MKGIYLEPGPKPNTVVAPIPDCVMQYLGWKDGDYLEAEIRSWSGAECLTLTRRPPPSRESAR